MNDILKIAQDWANHDPDKNTATEINRLISENNIEKLSELFAGNLEFGTAGLRAEVGPGQSRMNRAVVIKATYGLAQYLLNRFPNKKPKLIVGNDARNMSDEFAQDVCAVATALGLEVLRLPGELPTPVLAFAVRNLNADAGVMITASHNPPNDNGYKVYDELGAGIISPMDKEISKFIDSSPKPNEIELAKNWGKVDITDQYHERISQLVSNKYGQIKVAYTPMHGVGLNTFNASMKICGFDPAFVVPTQAKPDPAFPTVAFPNPEEPGAIDQLIALAKEVSADVAIANDPDADRCAIAINSNENWRMLSGDELGFIFAWWLIKKSELNNRKLSGLMAASIVSSSLVPKMAKVKGLEGGTTLTGMKWMGHLDNLIFGYEEAIGYCLDPEFVRDKDGISAALLIVELFSYLKSENLNIEHILDEIYATYGVHLTKQLSFRFDSVQKAKDITSKLISSPLKNIGDLTVLKTDDMAQGIDNLPSATGVRITLNQARIIVRPSGTEPKLKCYLEVTTEIGEIAVNKAQALKQLESLTKNVHEILTTIY